MICPHCKMLTADGRPCMYCSHVCELTVQKPSIVESSEYICPKCSTKFSDTLCPACGEQRATIVEGIAAAVAQKEGGENKSFSYLALYLIVAAVLGMFSPAIVVAGAFIGYILDLNSNFSHKSQSIGTAVMLLGKWCVIGILAFIPAVVVGVFIYGGFSR